MSMSTLTRAHIASIGLGSLLVVLFLRPGIVVPSVRTMRRAEREARAAGTERDARAARSEPGAGEAGEAPR